MKHLRYKMKRIFSKLLMSLAALALLSCGNEDEHFKYVDFKFTCQNASAKKEDLSRRPYNYSCEVSPEGGVIVAEATGKNWEAGYLSDYCDPDGNRHSITDAEFAQKPPFVFADEEWGKVEKMSETPYTTKITIYPNHSGVVRGLGFYFGGGYTISEIRVMQPSD